MGKGSSGGGDSTTTNVNTPPPQVMAAYEQALGMANTASSAPLQQYQGNTVAGFTPDQTSAMSSVDQLQGVSQPYINQAQGLMQQGTQPLWSGVQQFSPSAVQQYESPYTSQVLNSTMAAEQNQDSQQQAALQGNAISSGAWGGDRAGVASAVLSGQQDIANNATNANIENTGYSNALGEFNTQQQAQLGANEANSYLDQQAGYGLAGLGNEALNTGLAESGAQLQSGQLQQTQNQAELNVPYEQFQQQQAYPFQTAQYYANIAEGLGSNMGGTSSTTSPAPNEFSQDVGTAAGLGTLGYLGYLAATPAPALSDRRAKEDISKLGTVHTKKETYPFYSYKYKGDDRPQVGVIAQDVERKNPSAVHEINGLKHVDYSKLQRGGGITGIGFVPHRGQYDIGGGIPDLSISYVPSSQSNGAHGPGPPKPPAPYKPPNNNNGIQNLLQVAALAKSAGSPGASAIGSGMNPSAASTWQAGAANGDSFGDISGAATQAENDSNFLGPSPASTSGFNFGSTWKRGGGLSFPHHYDGGGMVGGMTPMTAGMATQTPQQQTSSSSYQNMTPEQLQMVMMRLPPNSQQSKIASAVLQQKRTMPNVGIQAQGGFSPQAQQQQPQGYDDGGDIPYPPSPLQQDVQQDVANEDSALTAPTASSSGLSAPTTDTSSSRKPDPIMSILSTLGGIGAGNSPYFGTNAGEGALAGLKNYNEQQKESDTSNYQSGELGVRKEEADARAKQMSAEADRWNAMLKQGQEKIDQDNWTMGPSGLLVNKKTGQIKVPSLGSSSVTDQAQNADMPQPVISGFPQSPQQFDPTVKKARMQADETNTKAADINKYYAESMLQTLDNIDKINDAHPDLWGSAGGMRLEGNKAAAFVGIGGQNEQKKADAMNEMDKNSTALATDWGNFQHIPGGRGSVMALKTILSSKPGVDQTYNTNKSIVGELRGRIYNSLTDNELAEAYRGAVGSPGYADGNVDNLDRTLKTLYPMTTTDPKTNQVIFHPENVEKYREAIPDAIKNPNKYFAQAQKLGINPIQQDAQGAQGSPQGPSPSDVAYLRANPGMAAKFEARFGQGSSSQILGGQ